MKIKGFFLLCDDSLNELQLLCHEDWGLHAACSGFVRCKRYELRSGSEDGGKMLETMAINVVE